MAARVKPSWPSILRAKRRNVSSSGTTSNAWSGDPSPAQNPCLGIHRREKRRREGVHMWQSEDHFQKPFSSSRVGSGDQAQVCLVTRASDRELSHWQDVFPVCLSFSLQAGLLQSCFLTHNLTVGSSDSHCLEA